jgi:hypothetical protein
MNFMGPQTSATNSDVFKKTSTTSPNCRKPSTNASTLVRFMHSDFRACLAWILRISCRRSFSVVNLKLVYSRALRRSLNLDSASWNPFSTPFGLLGLAGAMNQIREMHGVWPSQNQKSQVENEKGWKTYRAGDGRIGLRTGAGRTLA